MSAMLHAFAHLFVRIFVRWYTFLGTSPGGIAAQILILVLTEVQGGWWRLQAWRTSWKAGLKRAAWALGVVWVLVFAFCAVTTIYDDHKGLVNAVTRVSRERDLAKTERDQLKIKNSEQEQEITRLTNAGPKKISVSGIRRKLQFRFSATTPYTLDDGTYRQYRLGIYNPEPDAIGNVAVKLTDIRPRPHDPQFRSTFPIELYTSNYGSGIVLNPKDEELFVIATTWPSGDGRLIVADLNRKGLGHGSFTIGSDEQWHLILQVSSSATEPTELAFVMSVQNGRVILTKP